MSDRPQSALTDRSIHEALAGDREAPAELIRSVSDYAHSAEQQAPGLAGLLPLPRWGGRPLVVVLVVLGLLVVLGVAALGSRPSRLTVVLPPSVTPSAAPSTASPPLVTTPVPSMPPGWTHVADVPRIDFDGVGPELDGLLVLLNARIGSLGFLDPAAGNGGEVVERLDVGAQNRDLPIAQDAEGWWIGVGGTHELVRFDPATRMIARRMQIGTEAYRIAAAGPIVYVTDFANGRLSRVDTGAEEVTAARDLADAAGVAVLGDGRVLVATRPGALHEVDPTTLETLDEITIQGDVMSLVPDGDRVIVTRNNADRLSTFDPDNLAAGENLVETRVSSFTLTDDAAWAIDWATSELVRLDRDSLEVLERVPALSEGQDGIAVVAGDLWVEGSNEDGPVVHRVRPPTR